MGISESSRRQELAQSIIISRKQTIIYVIVQETLISLGRLGITRNQQRLLQSLPLQCHFTSPTSNINNTNIAQYTARRRRIFYLFQYHLIQLEKALWLDTKLSTNQARSTCWFNLIFHLGQFCHECFNRRIIQQLLRH